MASGGVITKAGWCGGGGNCVKIKHNRTYQTVYAHMKNFSSLAIPGNRVKQGQIIGYWDLRECQLGHICIMRLLRMEKKLIPNF